MIEQPAVVGGDDHRTASGCDPGERLHDAVRVPLVLTTLLPAGLLGAFAAVMLAAFISTHDTYLHSWGSIFIQDVLLPFRKKPFSQEQHLRVLRWSILGVAGFIFLFSLVYQPTQAILLYFAITGAIFAGGSGAVIIGGLYWKKGTTAGAWTAACRARERTWTCSPDRRGQSCSASPTAPATRWVA